MKKIYFCSLVWLVAFSATILTLLAPSPVYAAAPLCYKVRPDKSVTKVDCTISSAAAVAPVLLGHPLKDDHCYIFKATLKEFPITSGACIQAAVDVVTSVTDDATGDGKDLGDDFTRLDTTVISDPDREAIQKCDGSPDCFNRNPLIVMAKLAVNVLSALVGVVVVGVIVFAGIEYSSSGGDPGRTAAAKKRIVNAIIALVAFMFLYIALQWLIPGGLFT